MKPPTATSRPIPPPKRVCPGVIGNGLSFNGSGDKIVIPRSTSLNFSTGFTFSAWIRISQPQNDASLFSWQDGEAGPRDRYRSDPRLIAGWRTGARRSRRKKTADIPLQSWHLLTVTAEPSKRVTVFIDGIEMTLDESAGTCPRACGRYERGRDPERGPLLRGRPR